LKPGGYCSWACRSGRPFTWLPRTSGDSRSTASSIC
jgi:hypothetical protein